MIGAITFGRMSMNMIRHGPAPSDRAASTYSFSRIDSTWPRMIRSTDAQPRNPMTMTRPTRPPAEEPEADEQHDQPRADHRDEGDGQQQERDGEQQVHEAGQDCVGE